MKTILYLGLLVLTGCATTSNSPVQCLDARQGVDRFTVVAANEVIVQSRMRDYRVVLDQCDLGSADRIAFSNGPERLIWSTGRPVYATQLYSGHICGRAGDMLVWRRNFEDFRFPGRTCRVVSVERIPPNSL